MAKIKKKLDISSEGISDVYVAGDIIVDSTSNGLLRYDNYNSPYRPITTSELFNKLSSRDWNIADRKYIDGDRRLKRSVASSDDKMLETGYYMVSPGKEITDSIKSDLESYKVEHSDIIQMFKNMKESKTVYLYNSSELVFDILNDSVTMDLVGPDQYTSTLSLENLFKKASVGGISAKVDLSIKYSKGDQIYSHNMVFEAFKFPDSPEEIVGYTGNNFIKPINNEVSVEYIDNILRVIPDDSEIDECVISNCTVTYGNL